MWFTFPRFVGALSPLPVLIGCAFGGASGSQNVIATPALEQTKAKSAYDAIRQIRPEMLRTRTPGSLMLFAPSHPAVAIDNTVVGGIEVLRATPVTELARIEYVNSWQAAKAFGVEFRDGIVLLTRRSGSPPALSLSSAQPSK
jgi:hypothetical protein